MTLADELRSRIDEDGPLTFAQWMEACLYDPRWGYYMQAGAKTGAGADADFATSATLHPFMAHAIAQEALAAWNAMGQPAEFAIYEFGGGEGDLARDARATLDAAGCPAPWHHIEISPDHRAKQRGSQLDDLPRGAVGFVVAHEFLDALPFHVLERQKGSWAEVGVGRAGERFVETHLLPQPSTLEAAPRVEAQRVVAMVAARDWIRKLGERLTGGAVIVDYGGGQRMWQSAADGTVRTYRGQERGDDPLRSPGLQDITASVDFDQVGAWATAAGFDVETESQESFLVRHGALEALNGIDRNSAAGASSYLRLRQMILPHAGGMGHAFRVAVLRKR